MAPAIILLCAVKAMLDVIADLGQTNLDRGVAAAHIEFLDLLATFADSCLKILWYAPFLDIDATDFLVGDEPSM